MFAVFCSLLIAACLLFPVFPAPGWAEESNGNPASRQSDPFSEPSASSDHGEAPSLQGEPDLFEKNFDLSPEQKEYTITACEKVVSEIINPEMSDLEKYYTLAIWANKHVVYDWDFWDGTYNYDFYSHQWDVYGAMKEDEKSVCVGISLFYSALCHAADLPCRFARLNPRYTDHVINYIPDINGKAYYVDITENVFLMSEKSGNSYGPLVDKEYSHITKDCTDTAFDYRSEDGSLSSTGIKDCYGKSYGDWFREYALHENTTKIFDTPYVEKGSGIAGTHYASYHDYRSDFVEQTDVWFLDDFYRDPTAVKAKVLNREFDEQVLLVSGLKSNYDCDTLDELKAAVAQEISVKYFPTCEDGKIVARSAVLTNGVDYRITCKTDDSRDNIVEVTIEGTGAYSGAYRFRVTLHSARIVKAPVCRKGLVYDGSPQVLVEPGQAEFGEMQYAFGTEWEATEEFTSDLPSAVNAGRYYVWYKAAGDEQHADTLPQRIEKVAFIAPAQLKMVLKEKKIRVGETVVLSPELNIETPAVFTFLSTDSLVVSVTESGAVTGQKEGSAEICIECRLTDPGPNYKTKFAQFFTLAVVSDEETDSLEPGCRKDDNV